MRCFQSKKRAIDRHGLVQYTLQAKTNGKVYDMREYVPRYPLESLDRVYYPNLFRDSDNVVFSENLTYFISGNLGEKEVGRLRELESMVKKYCVNVDLAYHDFSGNRWILLVLDKRQTVPILRRMQAVYTKLHNLLNPKILRSQF